jgi:hypothetical protein
MPTLQPSPELDAMDLLRVDVDSFWNIEDLIDYEEKIKACVLALVGSLLDRRDTISPQSRANIAKLQERLNARLAHLYGVLARLREDAAEPQDEPEEPRKGAGAVHAPKL